MVEDIRIFFIFHFTKKELNYIFKEEKILDTDF